MIITIEDGVDDGVIHDNWGIKNSSFLNNGALGYMWIRNISATQVHNGFIHVDLTAITGEVTNAYFGFDVFGGSFPCSIQARTILVPWGEGVKTQTNATAGESSWLYSEKDDMWTVGGCNGDNTDRLPTINGELEFTATNSDTHFSLSNASVQAMIDNPATNYGWVIQNDTLVAIKSVQFRSSETTTGNKPYFYVEYTEGAAIALSRGRLINMEGNLGGLTKATLNNLGGI